MESLGRHSSRTIRLVGSAVETKCRQKGAHFTCKFPLCPFKLFLNLSSQNERTDNKLVNQKQTCLSLKSTINMEKYGHPSKNIQKNKALAVSTPRAVRWSRLAPSYPRPGQWSARGARPSGGSPSESQRRVGVEELPFFWGSLFGSFLVRSLLEFSFGCLLLGFGISFGLRLLFFKVFWGESKFVWHLKRHQKLVFLLSLYFYFLHSTHTFWSLWVGWRRTYFITPFLK